MNEVILGAVIMLIGVLTGTIVMVFAQKRAHIHSKELRTMTSNSLVTPTIHNVSYDISDALPDFPKRVRENIEDAVDNSTKSEDVIAIDPVDEHIDSLNGVLKILSSTTGAIPSEVADEMDDQLRRLMNRMKPGSATIDGEPDTTKPLIVETTKLETV